MAGVARGPQERVLCTHPPRCTLGPSPQWAGLSLSSGAQGRTGRLLLPAFGWASHCPQRRIPARISAHLFHDGAPVWPAGWEGK